MIIADHLTRRKIDCHSEQPLATAGVTKYPDFTYENDAAARIFCWEHCGMLHHPAYRRRWEAKLKWYWVHAIVPYSDDEGKNGTLIVTRDTEAGGISSPGIKKVIDEVILG